MYASRFFPARYFPPTYFPQVGAEGGAGGTFVMARGTSQPVGPAYFRPRGRKTYQPPGKAPYKP